MCGRSADPGRATARTSPLLDAQGAGTLLILFSGVPGTGKSTLADATGRELQIPVFAMDWLLGALTPFGGYHLDRMMDMRVLRSACPPGPAGKPGARDPRLA